MPPARFGGPSISSSTDAACGLHLIGSDDLYAEVAKSAHRKRDNDCAGYADHHDVVAARGRQRLATIGSQRYADFAPIDLNRPIGGTRTMSDDTQHIPAFSGPDGLVTTVAQDARTGEVLMVAHMNREAWDETLASGRAVYFSRARRRLWRKGEESGNVQNVREIFVDCDGDTVLLKVEQVGGAACHEGYPSCFFRLVTPNGLKIVAKRVFDPKDVYRKVE